MYIVTGTYRRHFCSRGMGISTHFPAPRRSPHRTGRTPPGLTNRHGPLPPAKETMTSPISISLEITKQSCRSCLWESWAYFFVMCHVKPVFKISSPHTTHGGLSASSLAFTNEWNVWYTCRLQPNLISENHVYRRNYCTWSKSNQFKHVTLAVCFRKCLADTLYLCKANNNRQLKNSLLGVYPFSFILMNPSSIRGKSCGNLWVNFHT